MDREKLTEELAICVRDGIVCGATDAQHEAIMSIAESQLATARAKAFEEAAGIVEEWWHWGKEHVAARIRARAKEKENG